LIVKIINNNKEVGDFMYTCKKCGTPLEKQLSECPICHTKNPAGEPESMVGKDLTETYDPVAPEFQLIRQKSRKLAAILAFGIGFLGIPLFYLGDNARFLELVSPSWSWHRDLAAFRHCFIARRAPNAQIGLGLVI
jgi:hypothetical protein